MCCDEQRTILQHTYTFVIYSKSWKEHVQHLAVILGHIQRAGLVINAKKCHIARPEVHYMGNVIGDQVIRLTLPGCP